MSSTSSSTLTKFKTTLSLVLLQYFRTCARLQLAKIKPIIIGITGSAGKTSTLHTIHAVLKPHFTTKASYKANSESGLPLNILGLAAENYSTSEWLRLVLQAPVQLLTNWKKYEIYIAEMGIDGPSPPKNMGYLLSIFQPKVGVFLNARPMHSQGFDPLITPTNESERKAAVSQAIAREKGRMITGLPKNGLAVLNADDKNVAQFAKNTQAQVSLFGKEPSNQVQLKSVEQSIDGTRFTFRAHWKNQNNQQNEADLEKSGSPLTCFFPRSVLPAHFGYSLAAAVAVGHYFGINSKQSCHNLENHFQLPPGRASLLSGINDSYILDSSYNSSAQAAIDMLELLATIAPKRKLALLGDIRELGAVAQEEHELVARRAAKLCDEIILVGPQMKKYALPIITAANTPVRWFSNAYEAAQFLNTVIQSKDTLLVKGSQNTLLLEIAVEELLAKPKEDAHLLCRRGEFWNHQRSNLLANSKSN